MKTRNDRQHRRFRVNRLALCVILTAVAAGGLTTPGQAAGIITHDEIVDRAIYYIDDQVYPDLAKLVEDYQDIVNYGAMFPDWGYAMAYAGKGNFYADYAEHAHSPRFRAALAAYLVPTFRGLPGSEEDRQAIAFLFGIISHQVADTLWHDLGGNPQAFEVVGAQMDGKSSTEVELGSELFVISDHAYLHPISMNAPADAVQFVYSDEFSVTVSAAELEEGKGLQQDQITLEVLASSMAWWYELNLPWTHANLYGYQPGGVVDDAIHTAAVWQQFWDWLSNYNGAYYAKPTASGTGTCYSWENACTLQTALSLAQTIGGGEIWVMEGTYLPVTGTDRAVTFQLIGDVAVYGGFTGTESARDQRDPAAHPTILSGDISQDDIDTDGNQIAETSADIRGSNAYHVVSGRSGATLDGFIVTAGNADGSNCPGTGCGGGMQNLSAFPTVRNVIFSGNAATSGGGMYNYMASPNVTNVTFNGNSATYSGGGMENDYSNPTVMNVTFSGNSASFSGGGMEIDYSNPTVTNVTFSGNSATAGGGVYINLANPTLRNVTFTGNSAASSGGGIYNSNNSSLTVHNAILWGNSGGEILNDNSTASVSDSVIQGGYTGGTNIITTDPLLGTLGDYGGFTQTIPIQGGSSAMDATNNNCPDADQRGVPRPQLAACDIGAFELMDTTAPETSLDSQTPSITPTTSTSIFFTFSATDSESGIKSFECDLDDAGFAACASPIEFAGLADGTHTFQVQAINYFNMTDPTPATYTWMVDTTAPTLNLPADITTLPQGPAGAVVNYTVTATDALDPTPEVVCTPPSGSTFPIATTTVNCTATDDAGNVASDSFNITVGGRRISATYRSFGAYDGTLRESSEISGISNFGDASGALITVGDDGAKRQYMGFLDFDTSALPEGAAITEVTLQVKVSLLSANLYETLGDMFAEVTNPFFGTLPNLQMTDFTASSLAKAGLFSRAAAGSQWVTLNMDPASLFAVNTAGRTQFRLRFPLDDSNNLIQHYIRFFSGNYLNIAYRPLLTIVYYVP